MENEREMTPDEREDLAHTVARVFGFDLNELRRRQRTILEEAARTNAAIDRVVQGINGTAQSAKVGKSEV